MSYERADGLLEILRSERGLNYTFLDRSRPSLTFKRDLPVPAAEILRFHNLHAKILSSFSSRLRKIQNALVQTVPPTGPAPETLVATTSTHLRMSLFPEDLLEHVLDFSPSSLLIRTDEPAVPWELVQANGHVLSRKIPCGRSLITRRPLKRVAARSRVRRARVLLVINPTRDLDGADDELEAVDSIFSTSPYVDARVLYGKEATTSNFIKALEKRHYDIVHYAGHSSLDLSAEAPQTANFHFADGRVDARYVAKILERAPPALLFLNSCDSAVTVNQDHSFDDLLGLSPALLHVGVEAIIGSLWPVIDEGAASIASKFYAEALSGKSIGESLCEAREAVTDATGFPYWLGYSIFGDPNLTVVNDVTWRRPFKSGGLGPAMSTFAGRSMLHVSSLHSFLMNALASDTIAIAVACECRNSEALVVKKHLDVDRTAARRPLNVGLPGKTGSAVFTRKMVDELDLSPDLVRFIELDTAEVVAALQSGSVDLAGVWRPELVKVPEEDFDIIYPSKKNDYTICVLVTRKPQTDKEIQTTAALVHSYKLLAEECKRHPFKWGRLLSDMLNVPLSDLETSISAFDFTFGGTASTQEMPERISQFISDEIELLKRWGLMSDGIERNDLFLWESDVSLPAIDQNTMDDLTVSVDVQKSVSSLPLLVGRFEGVFQ